METETAVLQKVPFRFPLQVIKFDEGSGEFHVVGYAATTDFDLQGDIISDAAIENSVDDLVKNSTVLLNHDLNQPIGRVTKVDFDQRGLIIDALISQTAPEVIQKIKEGILNKFSIRGQVLERHQEYKAEYQKVVNVIDKMSLVEVSLVSVPANPEARAIGWYVTKALRGRNENPQGGNMPENDVEIEEILPEAQPKAQISKARKPKEDDEEVEKDEAEPNVGDKDGQDRIDRILTDGRDGRDVFHYSRGRKGKDDEDETEKAKPSSKEGVRKNPYSMLAPMLDPVWPLIDRMISQGGPSQPIAQQLKVYLKRLVGDNSYPYPSTYPKPTKSKGTAVAVSVGEDDEDGEGIDMDEDADGTDAGMTGKAGVNRIPYADPDLAPGGTMEQAASRQSKVQKMVTREVARQVRQQVESILGGMPTVRKGLIRQEPDGADLKKQFDALDPEKKLKVALALQREV